MRRRFIPYSLLMAGLVLTGIAVQYALRTATEGDRLRFETVAERVRGALDSGMDAYVAMLLGGAGVFAASDTVEWWEFKAYVDRLELKKRYPGVQGMGFSQVIRPGEHETVASTIRHYAPGFHFSGDSDRATHAIVFLEPQDERNRVALGYDMYAEETRREAMDRARDTALPAATGRVRLVQEIDPDDEQMGFLVYVPVYRQGNVPATVEARRAQLLGFVYSPFRVGDLLQAVHDATDPGEATFDLFDGEPEARQWLHRWNRNTAPARFQSRLRTEVAGRTWTLVVHSGPAFAVTSGRMIAALIAATGILLSALLFSVTATLVSARHAAERRAEESRRSEEALRDANRAKDEFLAIVSHELRTPLNAIVGWASMLQRGRVPPENRGHAIEIIQRNAAAQTRLIEDLLDISRAVAGRLRLRLDDVDVAATLRAAAEAVKPAAEQQGVLLDVQVGERLGVVRADQARLQQVVLNVLSNAIKFTPAQGRVCLAASRNNDWVTVCVTDTGIGIPPALLPHVFDRFRQGDSSSTRAHGGIGLGLAICRHIAELHGGTIEAASEGDGRGTTCTIKMPVRPPASV